MVEEKEEKMTLSHGAVPGYRRVFHIIVLMAVIYPGIIFLRAFL
jgi:hypothetical protein